MKRRLTEVQASKRMNGANFMRELYEHNAIERRKERKFIGAVKWLAQSANIATILNFDLFTGTLCDEAACTKYKIAPISGKRAPSRICAINIKAATVGVFKRTQRGLSRRRAMAADI